MGNERILRTRRFINACKQRILNEQAQNAIEQHNFDRLVAQGVIVEGASAERETPQAGGEC